ncbi:MAG: Gfo/Idh/MocA family protein [Candidatus Sumerlaeaceae bacterium]
MMDGKTDRRQFLRDSAGFIAAAAATCCPAASYARIVGANNRVRVGVVGFADRSKNSLLPAFQRLASEQNFELVALSDIWNRRRDEGVEFLRTLTGASSIAAARNNEELYEMKDLDAVIIATADFQHALHGVEAVRAGRHAYIEKPLAQTMDDARAILAAVDETKKIVQIGSQRRSGEPYIKANEYIRSGEFGDINMVEMTWNVNQPGRWRRPQLVKEVRQEDTDWTRYLMNRPKVEWDPRKYIEYRLFWPYSTGIPGQWMVHQIDTIHWFTGFDFPRSVVASGGIYQWHDGRTNPDTMTAVFDYGPADEPEKGFQVVYSSRMGNSAGGTRELYYSNGGMINLDTGEISPTGGLEATPASAMEMQPRLLPKRMLTEKKTETVTAANTGVDLMTMAHMRNWMECIRSGKTPAADVRSGYNHSVAVCMTMAALETGKRVTFDAKKQDVVIS